MLTFDKDPKIAERQMEAIIFSLTAFGYIDGDFDASEKDYIRDYIAKLVQKRAQDAMGADLSSHQQLLGKWTAHFYEYLDIVDSAILALFEEPVAEGEDQMQFVSAKLKLRAFELFRGFDEQMREGLLGVVDELIHADGVVHESEKMFRAELSLLLDEPMELDDSLVESAESEMAVEMEQTVSMPPQRPDHPFLTSSEWRYSNDAETFAQQAESDLTLIREFTSKLNSQRALSIGKLKKATSFSEFDGTEPFLDGHVCVYPPKAGKDYELLVLGDLHGCYSCLKAALLQVDFFEKVERYHKDPENNPNIVAVFLGDYIDRGKFSYNGILRTIMQIYLKVPEHVIPLRGNHEYYVQYGGQILAPVQPSEAMNDLRAVATPDIFTAYMKLFEALPNMLVFDKTLFVHAGIPRDDTYSQKFTGLDSLNDPDISFQMRWSDPSETDYIPHNLQIANARFPFGKKQFKRFMSRIGCTTMIRGHERIVEGVKTVYKESDASLISLFSAGGKNNNDLPLQTNYREVIPTALTIKYRDGESIVTPFVIDYEHFNDPRYNKFF